MHVSSCACEQVPGPALDRQQKGLPPSIAYGLPEPTMTRELNTFNQGTPNQALRWKAEGMWMTSDDEFETTAHLENSLAALTRDLCFETGQNRTVPPEQWGMTVGQFNHFVNMCRRDTATWDRLSQVHMSVHMPMGMPYTCLCTRPYARLQAFLCPCLNPFSYPCLCTCLCTYPYSGSTGTEYRGRKEAGHREWLPVL